jgi:DNA-binding GntR family transcriptional regulator
MIPPLELPVLQVRRSIRNQVGQALRAALVSGQMRPGEVYSAPMLAARLGVSATPVREAMLDLVKEGLVVTAPNKGFSVRELSAREMDEITEIRRLLEIPPTVEAIGKATPKDLKALRVLAQEIVDAAANQDLLSFVRVDREFHLKILSLTGNSELVSLVGSLRDRARLYGIASLAETGELGITAREHLQIVDLIEAGDHVGLEQMMQRHISHVRGDNA